MSSQENNVSPLNSPVWFIVKTATGNCQIQAFDKTKPPEHQMVWGPFDSSEKAIAARIGLIRAGKCQPQ